MPTSLPAFSSPSEAHSPHHLPAAIPPSAALCEAVSYLLPSSFTETLSRYSKNVNICYELFCKTHKVFQFDEPAVIQDSPSAHPSEHLMLVQWIPGPPTWPHPGQ